MKTHVCALCHGIGIIHYGEPPGKKSNYLNRCTSKPLSGKPGNSGTFRYRLKNSWRGIARKQGICGFPMTDEQGKEIKSSLVPLQEFISVTRGVFDVVAWGEEILNRHRELTAQEPELIDEHQ